MLAFRPYPHRLGGRWVFGSVTSVWSEPKSMPMLYAPAIKAACLAALWYMLGAAWRPLWALMAWELLDLFWWATGPLRGTHTDGGRFWQRLRLGSG